MPILSRRNKRLRKNRTFKRGGSINETNTPDDREGVIDLLENKISDIASSAATTIEDTGLRIAGLERINKNNEENVSHDSNDTSSGILSNVSNLANKTSTAIIDNVNEVLGSNQVNQTVEQAGRDTSAIIGRLADTFNESMNDPIVKNKLEQAIQNAGELSSVFIESAKEPFNQAVDVAAESFQKATGAAVSGAVKVGTDAMAAIPGVGGVIEVGKIINDSSKAASAVIEAGSEAVETASDLFIKTKENMDKGLKALEEQKKMAQQISNRTTQSINQFENPIQYQMQTGGKRKSKKRLLKRRYKTKRVRFAI